jgi:single-strand DNA-binding protein
MLNRFESIGNVGSNPKLSTVPVGDEQRKVVNMRVYFDRPVGDDFKDKGGFWYTVDIWGYRAEEAMRVLKKGARIFVMGSLREESWADDSGEVKSEQRLTADYFFLDSVCIENVQYREKNGTKKSNSNKTVIHK